MTMQPVNSSNIAAIGYDPETQTLAIEFRSGGTYEYYDVPEQVFEGLMEGVREELRGNDETQVGAEGE
jgi:hypothetical protein